MKNRKIKTKIKKTISSPLEIEYGVPQGSCLGPLFFIIFVNDLFTCINGGENSEVIMYADDTVLISSGKSIEEAVHRSNRIYTKLCVWYDMNRLTINVHKTKHMFINYKKRALQNQSCIGGKLENVHTYKYLGVDIDDQLSFGKFIDSMWSKVQYGFYNFSKICPLLSESLACRIYKQTIMPLFEYASFIVDSATKEQCKKLDRLHEKALHLIYYKKEYEQGKRIYVNMGDLYSKYNLEPLIVRRKQQLLCIVYEYSKIPTMLKEDNPEKRVTRNFDLEFTNLTRVLKSPLYGGFFCMEFVA